jgi:hypothetical protein
VKNLIDELKKIVTPPNTPTNNGSLEQFAEIEIELGLQFPSDYKELIVTYGDGCWQGFWYLLNPFTKNTNLNLIAQASREGASGYDILSAERAEKEMEVSYPHAIWPDENGLFPWGITDNGGRFFWVTGGNPAQWPIIYYPSRDPDFQKYEMRIFELVLGAVSGTLPIFLEEFGGEVTPEGIPLFEKLGG